MATYNKFQSFLKAVFEKKHDLSADTLKLMLTLVAPVATNSQKSNLTEIAAGNGYSAGGTALSNVVSAQTSGVYKLTADDVTWTASGNMDPFRYVVLYNDTSVGDLLIGYWDYGSTLSLTVGQTFTHDLSASNGIFQDA